LDVLSEWQEVMERKGVTPENALKRIEKANLAFPDALVTDYDALILKFELPDEEDKHVLAAAIKSKANLIVTNNLKHFPIDYLTSLGLKVKNADGFLMDLIDLYPKESLRAFRVMISHKKNPPLSEFDMLNQLKKIGLIRTSDLLYSLTL
jgi:hypothetical protein